MTIRIINIDTLQSAIFVISSHCGLNIDIRYTMLKHNVIPVANGKHLFFLISTVQCSNMTIYIIGSHDRAVLLYDYVGKKTVDLQHTEVPDAFRGRGIAKHLAKVEYEKYF